MQLAEIAQPTPSFYSLEVSMLIFVLACALAGGMITCLVLTWLDVKRMDARIAYYNSKR